MPDRDRSRPELPEPFTNEWADLVFGLSYQDYEAGEEDADMAESTEVAEAVVIDPQAYEEKKEEQEERLEEGYRDRGLSEEEARAKAAETVKKVHMRSVDRAPRVRKKQSASRSKAAGSARSARGSRSVSRRPKRGTPKVRRRRRGASSPKRTPRKMRKGMKRRTRTRRR